MELLPERLLAEHPSPGSEQWWRSIFETSATGIAIVDAEGRFVATNPAYQELVGYTDAELRAMTPMDITYEEDRRRAAEADAELRAGIQRKGHLETRHLRKDGRVIRVRVTASTIPGGRMAFVEDITDRERAEEVCRPEDGMSPRVELTRREREVTRLVAEARSSKEIAAALDIKVKTVERHRTNVMRKLRLRSVADLVRYAIRAGIIEA